MTTATETAIPESAYDPFTMLALSDPHRHDGELRDTTPVAYLPQYDIYTISRQKDIRKALRDPRSFSSLSRPFHHPSQFKPSLLLMQDAPEHTAVKRVALQIMSKDALASMQEYFTEQAEALIDRVLASGAEEVDGVADIAQPYVLKVFPDVIGIPEAGREKLIRYGDAVFNTNAPQNELYHQKLASGQDALDWVAENMQRSAQNGTGLGSQIYAAADAGLLSEEDAQQLTKVLLAAGADTTTFSIGSMIRAFSENPDQWELLKRDPSLVDSAYEEVVRYYPPSRYGGRILTKDTEVGDVTLPEGARILLMWLAAGRDATHWSDPDSFRIDREGVIGHLSFGFGVHACLGQVIARMEARSVLRALLARVESITPAGQPELATNMQSYGTVRLPVRLTPIS